MYTTAANRPIEAIAIWIDLFIGLLFSFGGHLESPMFLIIILCVACVLFGFIFILVKIQPRRHSHLGKKKHL